MDKNKLCGSIYIVPRPKPELPGCIHTYMYHISPRAIDHYDTLILGLKLDLIGYI